MAVGPVEHLVIAFPGSGFTGAVVPVLADAVTSGAVRAGDLAFVRRAEGGALTPVELAELDPEGTVPADGAQAGGAGSGAAAALSAGNVEVLERSVPQGETVALVVREDLWTSRLARAFREAGGAFVTHERFGATRPDADADADADEAAEGDDIITRLERLAELWGRDVLTDAEFAEQKANLLAD
ncbi:DUF6325 family protein [Streptomyces cyaneofuscatus]|uniref:DUF6325 family protein n=1 Tax=Streptomyces cyaneofuscatus TaxID=66883 RepID=UPI0038161638